MSKPNKDGWIRHRGGKCPVEAGVKVDYRMRDGGIDEFGRDAGRLAWSHNSDIGDIMAYRIHKPAEQGIYADDKDESSEPVQVIYVDSDGPLQWRDRITEIDRNVEALEEERVSLVQRLEGEGLQLLQAKTCGSVQPIEDMSDWRNWRDGDKVLCIKSHHKEFITEGEVYRILGLSEVEEPESIGFLDDDGDRMEYKACNFKFHSRPSK